MFGRPARPRDVGCARRGAAAHYIGGGADSDFLRGLFVRISDGAGRRRQSVAQRLTQIDHLQDEQRTADLAMAQRLLDAIAQHQLDLAQAARMMAELSAWAQRVEVEGLPLRPGPLEPFTQHGGEAYQYLEATLPIIPGILSYKYEIGTQHQVDLRAIWDRLTARLFGRPAEGATDMALPPPAKDPTGDALAAYRAGLIAKLSEERYRVDKHFVRLTLLIDQGHDAQGTRFVEDTPRVQRLAPAAGRDARPGRGAARRARLRQDHPAAPPATRRRGDRLADGRARVSFFLPLNSYPLTQADPAAWLAAQWRKEPPISRRSTI